MGVETVSESFWDCNGIGVGGSQVESRGDDLSIMPEMKETLFGKYRSVDECWKEYST